MSLEDRSIVFDFQFKAIVEATNTLLKLTTVYFLIIGASFGYLFNTSLKAQIVINLVYGLIGISFLFLIICLAISYGVVRGLGDIKQGLAALDPQVAEETNIVNFIKRGARVSIVAIICSVGVFCILCSGLVAVLLQKLPFV